MILPCRAAEPGDGVFPPGLEVLGGCCCGFSCLLWIVSCLNSGMQTPRRCCFLLQEEIDGWGGGTRTVSDMGWFHTGLCPFWSRRREPGSPAGARGGMWCCRGSPLPRDSRGDGGGRGGFASCPAVGVRSPGESRGGRQRVLHPQLGAPWVLRRGDPRCPVPPIVLLSCQGLSQTTSLTSCRCGAALGAGWLIVTFLMLGREG